jgi:hypothetical protein
MFRACLRAGLEVAGTALANVVGPDHGLGLGIHKCDAGRLRALDPSAVREQTPGNFPACGFWFLDYWRSTQNVVRRVVGLDDLRWN